MKAISTLAIAFAIATPVLAQQQQQISTPTIFGIRSGETLLLTSPPPSPTKEISLGFKPDAPPQTA